MQLPGADRAVIEPRKLRDYLLSPSHPVGRYKATFFIGLGYDQNDWAQLASDLRELIASGDAIDAGANRYGRKHEVRGAIVGPSGRQASIVSVWITLESEDVPRFVTAYPEMA